MNTPEKDSNEIDLMNLPERDFKIKIINMFMEVQKTIQECRNEFRSEMQSLQSTVSEMKHTMEGFKSKLDVVKETINEIEIREEEYKEAEAQREKRISRNERILRELCDESKWNNIRIMELQKREKKG